VETDGLDARPRFERYIGIDYSGAETPISSLRGLRVYVAEAQSTPVEVNPPPSPRKYWTRRGIAEWLAEQLRQERLSLVGIDHGFSFPMRYFEENQIPSDWTAFLDDFQYHWPTDEDHVYVDFVREGVIGHATERVGNSRWRRLTEVRAGAAKSVFHFGVPGSVAHSTHAGLPWLRHLRRQAACRVHFWPFDGWSIPARRSVAYSIAAWMRRADLDGSLSGFFNPHLDPGERKLAEIEGWILGVA